MSGTFGTVLVNTRQLIGKLLARYAVEFAPLRELLQNADDAGATVVSIRVDVDSDNRIVHIAVENNGREFTEDDFRRMQTIADGNPRADSVGLFGVGFYAVFSLTDKPSIVSGGRSLSFSWKGDQLQTYQYAHK
jgi:HSP90 family molecular chaperone